MTKRLLYIAFLLALSSCGYGNGQKDQATPLESTPVLLEEIEPVEAVTWAEIINKSTDYNYHNFGQIGLDAHKYKEDTLKFPPIPGLVHKTVYVPQKSGHYYAHYAVLALRCPENPQLLGWMEGKVRKYVGNWPGSYDWTDYDGSNVPHARKQLRSAKEIANYYMKWLKKEMAKNDDEDTDEMSDFNLQDGLLLADCFRKGNLCTFYEGKWSIENNMPHEAFRTVDAETGKEMKLADLVDSTKFDRLSAMMMPRLISSNGDTLLCQERGYTAKDKGVLERLSGCGLIDEGLIIYFYPYNLGSGADGEYEAIIPYEEAIGVLKPSIRQALGLSENEPAYAHLDEAPLVDIFYCYRRNPTLTGLIRGWEGRLGEMFVDTSRTTVKTLIMERAFLVTESMLAEYNTVSAQACPVLLNACDEGKDQMRYFGYPEPDSTYTMRFTPTISNLYDCHFSDREKAEMMKTAYPIAISDTTLFRPLVIISPNTSDTVYSPLFECRIRRKPILVSTFDIDKLQSFPAGKYLWDIMRNYTYSDHMRTEVFTEYTEVKDWQWFSTMMPDHPDEWRLHE